MYAEGGATRTCEGRGSEEEEHVGAGGDDGGNAGSSAEEHQGGRRGSSYNGQSSFLKMLPLYLVLEILFHLEVRDHREL